MKELITTAIKYHGTNPGNWEFPWCAAFINKVLELNGQKQSGSLMARSFLGIGEHTDAPRLGDIVVLWRIDKNSQWGHAGFYINEDKDNITLLGGNQDNTVKIKSYPKWQLLDIRKIQNHE